MAEGADQPLGWGKANALPTVSCQKRPALCGGQEAAPGSSKRQRLYLFRVRLASGLPSQASKPWTHHSRHHDRCNEVMGRMPFQFEGSICGVVDQGLGETTCDIIEELIDFELTFNQALLPSIVNDRL